MIIINFIFQSEFIYEYFIKYKLLTDVPPRGLIIFSYRSAWNNDKSIIKIYNKK